MSADPVAVLVLRGELVESRHRAAACVADAPGKVVLAIGDVTRPVYPRSAVKPLQALALVESGAAARYGVGDAEIALACASHRGEPRHVEGVAAWLARIGLDERDLACGAHAPADLDAAKELCRSGASPGPLHNNCSGKHVGMLTLALALGAPVQGYLAAEHPVQLRIREVLGGLCDGALGPPAVDGCGLPTWPLPLAALATAMARLSAPGELPPARAEAAGRITAAMRAHPELVGGRNDPYSRIMAALPGVLVKSGAEGVCAAAIPGLGIGLKVEDGAGRATPVALLALLERLGVLGTAGRAALGDLAAPVLRNHAGTAVGALRPAPGWLPAA